MKNLIRNHLKPYLKPEEGTYRNLVRVLRLCLSSQNSVSPSPILCVSGAIWPPRRFHPRQIRISPSFGPSWTYGPTDGRHTTQYSDSVRIDGRLRDALLFFRRARF